MFLIGTIGITGGTKPRAPCNARQMSAGDELMAGNAERLALCVLLATAGANARKISVAVIKNPRYMFCVPEVGNGGQPVL